ncbi:hypothetical protein AVEN_203012-1 [Araneus ventricosus]|uniref:Uncharacterized protein n=1 Tax=Araneus ventricosus TaxID=182803 RepID=A0A4Y2EPK2_ARAVE|nr:hypothetical protein AVEN_203012-1 [Araneus ventricosus]
MTSLNRWAKILEWCGVTFGRTTPFTWSEGLVNDQLCVAVMRKFEMWGLSRVPNSSSEHHSKILCLPLIVLFSFETGQANKSNLFHSTKDYEH